MRWLNLRRPTGAAAFVVAVALGGALLVGPTRLVSAAPPGPDPAAELVSQFEQAKETARDPAKSEAERLAAWNAIYDLAGRLIAQFPTDKRADLWRVDKAAVLVDIRLDPHRKFLIYEVRDEESRKAMAEALKEARSLVRKEMADSLAAAKLEVENRKPFGAKDQKDWDLLDAASKAVTYQLTMSDLYESHLAWALGVRRTDDRSKSQILIDAEKSVRAFFEPFEKSDDPSRRGPALLALAWTSLFVNNYGLAETRADHVIADPKMAVMARYEAYTLKAQALRAAGKFGGSPLLTLSQVKLWPHVCNGLAIQANRTDRSPAKRVWELTPQEVKKILQAGQRQDLTGAEKADVVLALNDVIRRPDFYEAKDFPGLKAPEGGVQKLSAPARLRFNRLALEAALGTAIEQSQTGAMATLEEQQAFIDADPALKEDARWRVFNLLGQANTIMAAAIQFARTRIRDAASEGEAGRAAALKEARERYEQAQMQAEQIILDAAKSHEPLKPLVGTVIEMMLTDASLEKRPASTQPGALPTPEQLEAMSPYRLRRNAENALEGEEFAHAEAYYKALLRKADSAPPDEKQKMRDEVMFHLGRTHYLWGLKLQKDEEGKKPEEATSPRHFAAAVDDYFDKILPTWSDKKEALLYIRSSLLRLPMASSDSAHQEKLIAALIELNKLMAKAELDENRVFLADTYYRAGKYREAADEYGRVSPAFPRYGTIREYQCFAVIKVYDGVSTLSEAQKTHFGPDMAVLRAFADYAAKAAAVLATQPATQPAADPAARLRDLGATFRLEAARISYQVSDKPEKFDDAEVALKAIVNDLACPELVRDRAQAYLIGILLDRGDTIKTTLELRKLIEVAPAKAAPYIDDALRLLEKERQRLLQEDKESDFAGKAKVAEEFARTAVDQLRGNGGPSTEAMKEALDDMVIRWARTLNWTKDHQKAFDELDALHARHPRDTDLLIELGDAALALGLRASGDAANAKLDRAIACYDEITHMLPEQFREVWWRALIGQCEANLAGGRYVLESYLGLDGYDKLSRRKHAELAPGEQKEDPRLPAWLQGRYYRLIDKLKQTEAVRDRQSPQKRPQEESAAAPPAKDSGKFLHALILLGAGGVFLALVAFAYVMRTRRAKRESMVPRVKPAPPSRSAKSRP